MFILTKTEYKTAKKFERNTCKIYTFPKPNLGECTFFSEYANFKNSNQPPTFYKESLLKVSISKHIVDK